MSSKYVRTPGEIPAGEHWAIVAGSSVFIPGDERSRTHPGHGYPERTEQTITYQAFTDEAEFKAALLQQMSSRTCEVRGIHVTGERFALRLSLDSSSDKNVAAARIGG